jgi:ABC-2 type transport system ATP-binding protein
LSENRRAKPSNFQNLDPRTSNLKPQTSNLRVIALSALTKRYGSFTAVDRLDLEVPRGELFGFLGPNGAGKTTTLRMIAGILRPTSGFVKIAGIDIERDPVAAKAKLGFIPDRPFIYEKLTGAEFLRFVAGLYGQSGTNAEHRARELLALFDLEEWRDELVESYSHGMRQKLIISSAFVHRPEVIVVDEPMVGLDPKAAKILKDLFREFTRRGHTIMMSTHTLEVAQALCDRIAIIQAGKIRACGSLEQLRAESEAGTVGLEHIFLKLTGENAARELVEVLDA